MIFLNEIAMKKQQIDNDNVEPATGSIQLMAKRARLARAEELLLTAWRCEEQEHRQHNVTGEYCYIISLSSYY